MEYKPPLIPPSQKNYNLKIKKTIESSPMPSYKNTQVRKTRQFSVQKKSFKCSSPSAPKVNQPHYSSTEIKDNSRILRSESRTSNLEQNTSPFQTKKVYENQREFYRVFMNLIELEEIEEMKANQFFYKNETSLEFLDNESYKKMIQRFDTDEYSKSTKNIIEVLTLIKIKENPRRVAKFTDYKCKIAARNVNSVVIESTEGEILDAEIYIIVGFCLFVFSKNVPEDITSFNIGFDTPDSFKRIKMAMDSYLSSQIDTVINSVFLGQTTDAKLGMNIKLEENSGNRLFELNNSQIKALHNALNYKFSIIQGPPGTGKTQTISSIVYNINSLCRESQKFENEYFKTSSKILVCAASNSPVFDFRDKLTNKGLKVLQVVSIAREEEYKDDIGTLKGRLKRELKGNDELKLLKKKLQYLKINDPKNIEVTLLETDIQMFEHKLKLSIINDYDIICCTTRILQTSILKNISFEFIIVDEASQCFEPDIVICLIKNVKHLILVGDIHQLGPVVKSQMAKNLGFENTTIERLQNSGVPFTMLDTQYRMQPFLSKFSSINFYGGKIKDGKISQANLIFPKIVKTHGFFYHINSNEEKWTTGSSIINKNEAEAVINVIKYLVSRGKKEYDIGVITFYAAQREYLKTLAKENNLKDLDIMSVDESQSREKKYIILSCVRSNESKTIGFLDNYRRLNVALTRVKNGLVVCGNANNFVKSELWSKLVYYFQDNDAIFTGDLSNLKGYKVGSEEKGSNLLKIENKFSSGSYLDKLLARAHEDFPSLKK